MRISLILDCKITQTQLKNTSDVPFPHSSYNILCHDMNLPGIQYQQHQHSPAVIQKWEENTAGGKQAALPLFRAVC